ncbi:hypothetical protein SDRG_01087 [Saprolegnia diclina VS20]|uniref:ubiquitinyl hydrolase 1 n=1 Tax=Saprolegnia diclina (strain VS20) TaxID=1156394 RepID=T0SAB7_SAPDV|nr:hypothetical protein SDRG_01087 [Saprolegnia diclina VS20]EQC42253.1 hypothetical protein SDRG_01087 [Saprolegnia diclina VS20]|eukprot:XP_008604822.1 hypothetical protein SDRG_01087 [Saprolegnia diclina VS20]
MSNLSMDAINDIDNLDELRAILEAHRQELERVEAQVAVVNAAKIPQAVVLFNDAVLERTCAGLRDAHGTKCYMYATLVCLAHTASFVRALCNEGKHLVTKDVAKLLLSIRDGSIESMYRSPVYGESIVWDFHRGEQEDAHDYYLHLMRQLYGISDVPKRLFKWKWAQVQTCAGCSFESRTLHSTIMFIAGECDGGIGGKDDGKAAATTKTSVVEAIQAYLHEDVTKLCEDCGVQQNHSVGTEFTNEPDVLVVKIHLFNIKVDAKAGTFSSERIVPTVDFQAGDDIQLASSKYRPSAFLTHIGSKMSSGHYKAYVRGHMNQWFEVNNHVVRKVNIKKVDTTEAYLIFFEKTP